MLNFLIFIAGAVTAIIVLVVVGFIELGANTWEDNEDMER